MKKVLLDFKRMNTQEEVQDYLAGALEVPDYYGKNLNALYDYLTDIGEDTCIGLFGIDGHEHYLNIMGTVFADAEMENEHLCVIFDQLEKNYKENEGL